VVTHSGRLRRAGGCDSDSVCWLLQLTCLAPDLVEAILNGRQLRD
jgi:hypothetical protein